MAYHHQSHHHIVCLRHAQSEFNLASIKYAHQNKVSQYWDQLSQIQDFKKQVSYNPAYLDPSITQHGFQQCKIARKQLNNHEFDLVIVSPHLRTLQTCEAVFGGRNIPIIVDPIFSEVFRYSCDVSSQSQVKKKVYRKPEYNWDEVDKWGQFWYVNVLPEKEREFCMQKLKQMTNETYRQKQKMILNLMYEQKIYEHDEYMLGRTALMKKQLNKYCQKYKNVVIVSHYYALTYLLAKQFNEHTPQKWDLRNCYPYWSSADELSIKDIQYDQ